MNDLSTIRSRPLLAVSLALALAFLVAPTRNRLLQLRH